MTRKTRKPKELVKPRRDVRAMSYEVLKKQSQASLAKIVLDKNQLDGYRLNAWKAMHTKIAEAGINSEQYIYGVTPEATYEVVEAVRMNAFLICFRGCLGLTISLKRTAPGHDLTEGLTYIASYDVLDGANGNSIYDYTDDANDMDFVMITPDGTLDKVHEGWEVVDVGPISYEIFKEYSQAALAEIVLDEKVPDRDRHNAWEMMHVNVAEEKKKPNGFMAVGQGEAGYILEAMRLDFSHLTFKDS